MEHPENDAQYTGLTVNSGVAQPPSVNPYMRPRRRKPLPSPAEMVDLIIKGDVTTLSRAVTLVESINPEHEAIAQEVIEKCLPYSGNSRRIGITGVPGAGKSTSIDVFGLHVLRNGGKLAVLAIDPSSERTKGSILGDKTRMEKLSVHPDAFIRPSPSAGSLGGVARKTRETIVLCEAAGFNNIFVETVGVGQSETAVHSMVDFFLLIQLAGTGDELQGIKRGIMEMADGIVINKADGDNIDRARLAQAQFRSALHLFPPTTSGWMPEVLTYSGYYELGIAEVWEMIDRYFKFVKENGYFELKRQQQARYWMRETIDSRLRNNFYNNPEVEQRLAALENEVLDRFTPALDRLDVYNIPDWETSAARLRENACDRFAVTQTGFTAHIAAKEAGMLVFTIPYDKGFTAAVDGQKTGIIPCDVAFMGVWVEPGEHEIVFTYKTRMLGLGVAMSAVSAVILAAYVILAKKKKLP